ncbi:glycosyltransferase [Streptomonospora arabica]|uniref:Glycosyltransferase n=1 Tax=Streptomonospora arabica TaxID=412417 RepID=A0ABV9SSL4_9ACTN
MTVRVLLLGAPQKQGDGDCWHDDIAIGGRELGWQVDYRQVHGASVEDLVRAAKGADLVVWARTHGHEPDGDAAAMLRRMEDAGSVTVGIHFDLYWGLSRREQRIGNDDWWTCQYVFTADGGDRDWAGRGVNHHWLPPAASTRFFGRGDAHQAKRGYEAVFVGGNVATIHGRHRADLLAWCRRRWGERFAHIGARDRSKVWGRTLNDLYAATGVVVGDSAPADYYWSDRLPRTLGRGGLLAYPRTEGMEQLGFTGDVLLPYARGRFDQIGAQLDALSPARAREMTDAALTLVEERHLFRHRMRQVAETVGLA